MHAPGQPKFAEARRAPDQNCAVPRCSFGHLPVHGPRGRCDAGLGGHVLICPWPHDRCQTFQEGTDLKWLGDIIRSTRADQPDRLINPALPGDEQKRRRMARAGQGVVKVFAGAVRQANVADHRVQHLARGADGRQGAGDAAVPLHLCPLQCQALDQGCAHDLVILDQHDPAPLKHARPRGTADPPGSPSARRSAHGAACRQVPPRCHAPGAGPLRPPVAGGQRP